MIQPFSEFLCIEQHSTITILRFESPLVVNQDDAVIGSVYDEDGGRPSATREVMSRPDTE